MKATKRVRNMDVAVWDAIKQWGKTQDPPLEMADALARMWLFRLDEEIRQEKSAPEKRRTPDSEAA
jgi:hypothetical protein